MEGNSKVLLNCGVNYSDSGYDIFYLGNDISFMKKNYLDEVLIFNLFEIEKHSEKLVKNPLSLYILIKKSKDDFFVKRIEKISSNPHF